MGLQVLLSTADGEVVENPRQYRKAERHLKQCQRRVARRTPGSHRGRKAVALLARAHQDVRRQRADFHHKTALALVRRYDVIDVEAIQPANVRRRPAPQPDGAGGYARNGASRKAGLNTSIQDAGWGHFLTILACKAACAGKRVEAVNPASTSQDCSGCGERVPEITAPCAPTSAQPAASCWTATRTRPGTSNGAGSAFGDSRGCLRG